MSIKHKIIDEIIRVEGGFVDDPSDSGGATRFGITERVARNNGYQGEMRDLPRSFAFRIYEHRYWDAVQADALEQLSDIVAAEVVDTAVNAGTDRAAKILQRALNVLNVRGTLYADIAVDSAIGPATLAALRSYLTTRDAAVLVSMLNCLQGAFYVDLAERRAKDEKFIYGWFKNRVKL